MATVIQIKRSTGVSAPTASDLAQGELAYSMDASNSGAGAIKDYQRREIRQGK